MPTLSSSLHSVERLFFRPLIKLITFVVVVFAIMQASGRFMFEVVHLFEDEVNEILQGARVEVTGLAGSWRWFNPVLTVERVKFPAGSATDLAFELDVLESVYRSGLVMRRAAAADVELILEQVDGKWRLLGQQDDQPLPDLTDLLMHSDELDVKGKIAFVGGDGETSVIAGSARLRNQSADHHVLVSLRNADDPEREMNLQGWQFDDVRFSRQLSRVVSVTGAIQVPAVLSAMPRLELIVGHSYWHEKAGQGAGNVSLTARGIELPGTGVALEAQVAVDLRREPGAIEVATRHLAILEGKSNDRIDLAPIHIQFLNQNESDPAQALLDSVVFEEAGTQRAQQIAAAPEQTASRASDVEWQVNVWSETLDLAAVGGFVSRHLGDIEPVGRWVTELALEGSADDVIARYGPISGLGFGANVNNIVMQGYKGAPSLTNGFGRVWGYEHSVAMELDTTDATVQFPDLFQNSWSVDTISGVVTAWFGGGYLGLRGTDITATIIDADSSAVADSVTDLGQKSDVSGGFAVTRPSEKYEQRLTLELAVNAAQMDRARTFVPFKIPEQLATWLEAGPQAGELHDAHFYYQGQVHVRPGELGRRIELVADFTNADVYFDAAWPLVSNMRGRAHAAGTKTRVWVEEGVSADLILADAHVILHDNAAYADVSLNAIGDGGKFLEYVHGSPLRERLGFVKPEWSSAGQLRILGQMAVPLKTTTEPGTVPDLAVDLTIEADDLMLSMPDLRVQLEALTGEGTFQLPHQLEGEFSAKLFEQPAQIIASSNDDWLKFEISGEARPDDVYAMILFDGKFPMQGSTPFESMLSVAMKDGLATNMAIETDLFGLSVNLPGEFSKSADERTPSEFDIQFLPGYSSVAWRYQRTNGWLHYGDEVERGAIGIGVNPPMTAQEDSAILISGAMAQAKLSDWVSDSGDANVALPLDWTIRRLKVGEFLVDELAFNDVTLSGKQRGDAVSFDFKSPDLVGQLALASDAVLDLQLEYLRLPTFEDTPVVESHSDIAASSLAAATLRETVPPVASDPLSVAVGYSLPAANVRIAQLDLGDEPFGAWSFTIQPEGDLVRFDAFNADVQGVHIADGKIEWDLKTDRTDFLGPIGLDDLYETLPKWDYAPSLQTSRANLHIDAGWSGSPVNINLLGLDGNIAFSARDGRFLEVESGNSGLKILSLLNFSNIAKRISFDFSDVVEDGIEFSKIKANVRMQNGRLDIIERMKVESTSSDFQVGGTVDLNTGVLDNEMIVTLPVSNSLPWYGVYLALANPLAGLGVLVGERVLRKPIQQFSTAKFSVTGTLDEPEVNFVSLFDRSMRDNSVEKPTDTPTDPPVDKPVIGAIGGGQHEDGPLLPSGALGGGSDDSAVVESNSEGRGSESGGKSGGM